VERALARWKEALDEGHGFSRAINGLPHDGFSRGGTLFETCRAKPQTTKPHLRGFSVGFYDLCPAEPALSLSNGEG
jgi:hypothetical protein